MLRGLSLGSLAVVALGIALWLILQWGILPRIESLRPWIEQRASAAMGLPVRIGAMQATERGMFWAGTVELQQVVLIDPRTQQEALVLPRVRASLSPTSLWPGWDGVWRLRLRHLSLDAPELDVRRDAQGHLSVAGLEVGRSSDGGEALADWFFSQPEFAITGGRVTWIDDLRDAPPLTLRDVDLVVRSDVRRHAMRLDATPPADWGARFSVRGDFVQPLLSASPLAGPASDTASRRLFARPGDMARWRGTVYGEFPAIDLAPLQRYVVAPFDPTQGVGAVRAWVDVRDGQPLAVTTDLQLRELALRLSPEREPVTLTHVDGRLALKREPAERAREERWSVELKQFGFSTKDGLDWPAADARVVWRRSAGGALSGGEMSASRFDLARLTRVLDLLPASWVDTELRTRWSGLAPTGEVSRLLAGWSGSLEAPQRYRVQGRLSGFGVLGAVGQGPEGGPARPGRPGVEGADIDLNVTEAGGEARLAIRDGALVFPGVLEQPRVEVATLDTTLAWQIESAPSGAAPHIDFRARDLRFANADLQAQLELHWLRDGTMPATGPGVIDLTGKLARAEATQVPRYLPLAVGPAVRGYLQRALQAGQARDVSIRLRGALAEFPFGGPATAGTERGEFRVTAQFDGVRLAYLPGDPPRAGDSTEPVRAPWPAFDDLKGELVFDRQGMQLHKVSGRVDSVGSGGLQLRGVEAGIRDLGAAEPVLVVEGGARGPLNDALRYIDATPVGGWLGDALVQAAASGGAQPPVELKLGLTIPLNDGAHTQVRGSLLIAGNDLKLRPDVPLLAATRARIDFTERSFSLSQGAAKVLGGEAQFDGALQPDGSVRFNVQGSASAEGLRRAGELGGVSHAAAVLGGQTGYRLALGFVRDQVEWQLNSTLAGLSVDLPAPLGKRADQVLPLRIQASLQPVAAAGVLPRDNLRVDLGTEGARALQAQYLRELAPGGARPLRGSLAIGASIGELASAPLDGVSATVAVASLDLKAWQLAADRLALPSATAVAASSAQDVGYLPARLNLRTQELKFGSHRVTKVTAALARGSGTDSGAWTLDIDAAEVAGRALYHPPDAARGDSAGQLMAKLTRLSLPKGDGDPVGSLLDEAPASSVPALDIVVEDFELRGLRLGRLEIEAMNRPAGATEAPGGGEWQLKRLRLVTPEAQLTATGRWGAPARAGEPRRTALDFKLEVGDGGALLGRLGHPDLMKGAKGRIGGQIDWQGSPLQLDYPSLGGQMTLEFDRGQFLQADPGAAKLLGVLSLQSLPRRLLFDFRDVFSQGFAFDAITGDVQLARGVASTRNLRLRGVQAVVLMEGSADVERETQDLRVWVVPEINAGTASLAYAAINPLVGIGSFLAQLFLRRPLAEASTREFQVTGPWAAPQVERVERRQPVAPAASGSAPGAPPS